MFDVVAAVWMDARPIEPPTRSRTHVPSSIHRNGDRRTETGGAR
jgi:hypothetical protein